MHRHPFSDDESALPAGLPLTWTFGRDLPCPQCGYNLRSLRIPNCPECGFSFRWQSVLGVVCQRCGGPLRDESGRVCPHCFDTLDWSQLLGRADPRQQLEFEYSMRYGRPYLHTLVATVWPWTFWSQKRLATPPNRSRLRRYRAISIGLGLIGLILPVVLASLGWVAVDIRDWLALTAALLIPPGVILLFIDHYGRGTQRYGARPERRLRFMAYSSSLLAWQGSWLLLAALAAVLVNFLTPVMINGQIGRPANALRLESGAFFEYLVTGTLRYNLHPIEGWFHVGIGCGLSLFAVAWWWPFLFLGLRRVLRMSRSESWQVLAASILLGYGIVLAIWLHAIPDSPFISRIVSGNP